MQDNKHNNNGYIENLKSREEKAKHRQKKIQAGKMRFMQIVFTTILVCLCGRVAYIKIVKGEEYERAAMQNQATLGNQKVIPPQRGAVVDRNKQNIAISNFKYNVVLDIRLLSDQDKADAKSISAGAEIDLTSTKTFARLNELLGIPISELQGYIAKDSDEELVYDTNYMPLGVKVDYNTAASINEDKDIKCIFLFPETERTYINNNFAVQAIGFIRGDNQWGLERVYNSELTGVEGRSFRTYDENNMVVDMTADAIPGHTLVTTLDFRIQQIAQEATDKAYAEFEPERASVIVMNPYTGEIYAMAQSPGFNPNDPSNIEYINDYAVNETWDLLEQSVKSDILERLWTNFNVSSTFEPGSIFKPMVIAAALEENVISPNYPEHYHCIGYKIVPGWDEPIYCHLTSGHGYQTLDEVLANSCNVAMMEIGDMMGKSMVYKYLHDFGYGEKTGIDLPSESEGVIHPLSLFNQVELATYSFGQGFGCTPIQAINSFAAVINGGNLMQPYIVSSVLDQNNNVIKENTPTIVKKVVSKEVSDYLRTALVKVVTPEGTGKRAVIEGYNIGGKTGTGQQGRRADKIHTVSFIAYLPAEDPEILAMALIHKPKGDAQGSTSAAPMLKQVLEEIIQYKGIRPSDPENTSITLSIKSEASSALADFTDMPLNDAIANLNRQNIMYQILGTGGATVANQSPAPGSFVDETSVVYLNAEGGDGEELITVSDYTNLSISYTQEMLGNLGLVPIVRGIDDEETEDEDYANSEEEGDVSIPEYIVVSQLPEQGVKVPKNTQIIIYAGQR